MLKHPFRKISRWLDYNPPGALSSKGWRLFKKEFKENAPIRFWFKYDFRHAVILPIKWKYTAIADWIRYRTTRRYHVIKTGLPPGYNELNTVMLYTNFTMLKDFVEVEQAWHRYIWSDDAKKASWFEKHMPFYRVFYPYRDPEQGLAYLDWAATLDDPALPPMERCDHQAVSARETRDLYDWWVNKRPARKEIEYPAYSDQGLDDLMACFDDDFDRTAPDFVAHTEAMDASSKQSEEWEEEDTAMLIRLIKLRKSLWT